jgi:hypothetical protein
VARTTDHSTSNPRRVLYLAPANDDHNGLIPLPTSLRDADGDSNIATVNLTVIVAHDAPQPDAFPETENQTQHKGISGLLRQ